MTNEDGRITIDMRRMFPEAVRRVEILERLKRSWPSIVGTVNARYSWPCVLGANGLTVEAVNEQAKSRVLKMKGNILRAFTLWGYNAGQNFTLNINARESQKKITVKKPVAAKSSVSEEKVRQYMSGAPETLPEDINYALSHLKAYLEGRR